MLFIKILMGSPERKLAKSVIGLHKKVLKLFTFFMVYLIMQYYNFLFIRY